MKKALILIDIQNDYFPGGRFELNQPDAAAQNAQRVLAYFKKRTAHLSCSAYQHEPSSPLFQGRYRGRQYQIALARRTGDYQKYSR